MPKTRTIPVKLSDVREMTDYDERAARIKDEFLDAKKPARSTGPQVGPAMSMRQRILALSLFPNLYNKMQVMTHE